MVIVVGGPSRQALAQQAVLFINTVQSTVNPRLSFERMRRVRTRVRDTVGKRLAPGPPGGNPDEVAVQPTGLLITPTADVPAVTPHPKWNAWIGGTYTDIDDDDPLLSYSGSQSVVMTGADYRPIDRLLLGGLFVFSESDVDSKFVSFGVPSVVPGSSITKNYGVGGYVGYALSAHIMFDGSFLYNWTDNASESSGVTADFNSKSWNLNANLTGYWYLESLRWSPTIGVSYARSRDDAYGSSSSAQFPNQPQGQFPSQVAQTGALSLGMALGYSIALDDVIIVEPYVDITTEYQLENSGTPNEPIDRREWNTIVGGGINFALGTGIAMSLTVEVGGLDRKRYHSLAGGGQLAVRF